MNLNAMLSDLGYEWARVGGSRVAHLIPPLVKRDSRTVCGRLRVADTQLQLPERVRTCQACAAYGARL